MADTGLLLPATSTNYDDVNTDWTTPGNVTADDGSNATVTLAASTSSDYMWVRAFGVSIPAGSTVDGIEVTFDRNWSDASAFLNLFLSKNEDFVGTGKNVLSGNGTTTLGSPSDLWGTTWSEAEVEAATFGMFHNATNSSGSNQTLNIDAIWVKIYYTEPGTAPVLRVMRSNLRW